MPNFGYTSIDGKKYRFSLDERRISGRPSLIQYKRRSDKIWRNVRNVDMSDLLWKVADGMDVRIALNTMEALGRVPQKDIYV